MMEIKLKGGVHHLNGRLDEFLDLAPLEKVGPPIKLNIREITSINSNGIRKFLAFIVKDPKREMEFHECTPEFIANVNIIPQILGQPPNARRIKSLFVPLTCESCDNSENHLVTFDQIKPTSTGTWDIAPVPCKACKKPMALEVEPSDYFLFMEDVA
jgi:hypothetical protein